MGRARALPNGLQRHAGLLDIRNGLTRFYTDKLRPARVDNSSIMRPYYVRVNGMDRWLQTRIDKMLDCGIITRPWRSRRSTPGPEREN